MRFVILSSRDQLINWAMKNRKIQFLLVFWLSTHFFIITGRRKKSISSASRGELPPWESTWVPGKVYFVPRRFSYSHLRNWKKRLSIKAFISWICFFLYFFKDLYFLKGWNHHVKFLLIISLKDSTPSGGGVHCLLIDDDFFKKKNK